MLAPPRKLRELAQQLEAEDIFSKGIISTLRPLLHLKMVSGPVYGSCHGKDLP